MPGSISLRSTYSKLSDTASITTEGSSSSKSNRSTKSKRETMKKPFKLLARGCTAVVEALGANYAGMLSPYELETMEQAQYYNKYATPPLWGAVIW